jgi:hypothetical protein
MIRKKLSSKPSEALVAQGFRELIEDLVMNDNRVDLLVHPNQAVRETAQVYFRLKNVLLVQGASDEDEP